MSSRWSGSPAHPDGVSDPDEAKTAPMPVVRARPAQPARPPVAASDPDNAKTAPQPAIRVRPARQARPGGAGRAGNDSRPVSSESRPLSDDSGRAGNDSRPVSSESRPVGGDESRPAGDNSGPVGHGSDPASHGTRPASYDEDGFVPGMWRPEQHRKSSRTRSAHPSWLRIIATTLVLWLKRRDRRDRGTRDKTVGTGRWIRAVTLALVVLLAAVLGVALSRNTKSVKPSQGNAVLSAEAARSQAASWIVGQVSRDAIVSCDPVMCSVLEAHGYLASSLDVLTPSAPDPLDSDLIAATAVLRSQFGSRLTSVYAPVVIASFGTGSAAVDIRAIAPDGGPAYLTQFRADSAARKSEGAQLLQKTSITVASAARRQLAGGLVDSRLLVTIATMAHLQPLNIVTFGDASPGASPGVPLRSATLTGGTGGSADSAAVLSSLRAFIGAQQPPYLPAATQIVRLATGQSALRFQFAALGPLGLLNAGPPVVKIPPS